MYKNDLYWFCKFRKTTLRFARSFISSAKFKVDTSYGLTYHKNVKNFECLGVSFFVGIAYQLLLSLAPLFWYETTATCPSILFLSLALFSASKFNLVSIKARSYLQTINRFGFKHFSDCFSLFWPYRWTIKLCKWYFIKIFLPLKLLIMNVN